MVDTFKKRDKIDDLSAEQLELIVRTQSDILLMHLAQRTIFDVQRIRLMLELGAVEAKRRLDALRSNC